MGKVDSVRSVDTINIKRYISRVYLGFATQLRAVPTAPAILYQ